MLVSGSVSNEIFQGYGIIEWTSGDVYCGNLKDNLRHGYGIWRSADGTKEVRVCGSDATIMIQCVTSPYCSSTVSCSSLRSSSLSLSRR